MSTSQLEKFQDEVVIPEGITVTQKKHMLTFVGPLGKTHKSFRLIPVEVKIAENKILLKAIGSKKEIMQFYTQQDQSLEIFVKG